MIIAIQESIVFVLVESMLLGKGPQCDGDLMHKVLKNPEYLANIQLGFEHVVPHGLEHKRIPVPLRTKTYKVCTIPRAFIANKVKKNYGKLDSVLTLFHTTSMERILSLNPIMHVFVQRSDLFVYKPCG